MKQPCSGSYYDIDILQYTILYYIYYDFTVINTPEINGDFYKISIRIAAQLYGWVRSIGTSVGTRRVGF